MQQLQKEELKNFYATQSAHNASIQKDLMVLQEAVHYREWLYAVIEPYVGQRVLEIGAGIGNYTEQLGSREKIWATDFDPVFVEYLEKRFADRPEIQSSLLDLNKITQAHRKTFSSDGVDTILALNVLEHTADDTNAVRAMKDCLAPGGRLVMILPALEGLFNRLDQAYDHYRRYDRGTLWRLEKSSGLELEKAQYFNLLGTFGWWLNGKMRQKQNLPGAQTRLFNTLTPLLRKLESVIPVPVGLSLLAVFKKS